MARFGASSKARLNECHPDLQKIAYELIKGYDFTVLCGHRSAEEQAEAFRTGRSRATYGQSPHNYSPALAMDIAPYPVDFKDLKRFDEMLEKVLAIAKDLGIAVTLGRDFKNLHDYPHVELTDWRKIKGPLP